MDKRGGAPTSVLTDWFFRRVPTELDQTNKKVSALSDRVTILTTRINNVEKETKRMNEAINNLENEERRLEGDVEQVEGEVHDQQRQIEELKKELAAATASGDQTAIEDVTARMKAINDRIEALVASANPEMGTSTGTTTTPPTTITEPVTEPATTEQPIAELPTTTEG